MKMNELIKISDDINKAFSKVDLCKHKWKPFKEGTVICEFCGIFAKVGYMEKGGDEN